MRPLTISNPEVMIAVLQDEIRRSSQSRYDHRLHGVLLVANGMSANQAAHLLGDAPRTVQNWTRRFEEQGLRGLQDAVRPGRPARLSADRAAEVQQVLRGRPRDVGLRGNLWDGKSLAAHLQQRYGVKLKPRQCRNLLRQWGFRYRKPRSVIAHGDPAAQAEYKKTPTV